MAFLVQRVAQSLDDATVDLALRQFRIDGPPAVVHGHDASHLDAPGFGVDLHFGELHATDAVFADGKLWRRHHEPFVVVPAYRAMRDLGHSSLLHGVLERDPRVPRAAHADPAILEYDVV